MFSVKEQEIVFGNFSLKLETHREGRSCSIFLKSEHQNWSLVFQKDGEVLAINRLMRVVDNAGEQPTL